MEPGDKGPLEAEQKLDDTEQLEVVLKPLPEAIEMLNNNEFLQALHISSLYYALKNLGKLWRSS